MLAQYFDVRWFPSIFENFAGRAPIGWQEFRAVALFSPILAQLTQAIVVFVWNLF